MLKKVLIASESTFRRIFLSEMLADHKEIVIVDNVRNDSEAIDVIRKKNPDVLILDIEIENKDWYIQFYPVVKFNPIKTIVLTDINPKDIDIFDVPIILKSYDYIIKPIGIWKGTALASRYLFIWSTTLLNSAPVRSILLMNAILGTRYLSA